MGRNPSGKARIVARIRADSRKECDIFDRVSLSNHPWISITRPGEESNPNFSSRVKISFRSDQISSGKQCYEVDECYEQDIGNEEIFSKEIKHLIPGLFEGQNSTVFAYGPRSSGKTFTVQGSEEAYGLVALTMDSVLPRAEEKGKIITVSVFEVYQDRIIDVLDSKRQDVSVFEDGQGKIRLKGLSKVKVNSTLEFQKLYCGAANTLKTMQKMMLEPLHRSHIGCIVHVVTPQNEKSNAQLVGKINFIDLASYEDSRRKSGDGTNLTETTRINKSLYAVHNVLYALNANEVRVPYRESKLTRMLQDSLGGTNKVLMISCMNPKFCPDTVQTISLASRSCQAGFLACLDPGRSKSGSKTAAISSPQVSKLTPKFSMRNSMISPRVMKPMSASASSKKQTGSQLRMSMKKPSGLKAEVKGRKLFDETNLPKKSEQGSMCPESASANESSAPAEIKLSPKIEPVLESCLEKGNRCPESASTNESSALTETKLSQKIEPVLESTLEKEKLAVTTASEADTSQWPSKKEKSGLKDALDMDSSTQLPPLEDAVQAENVPETPAYQTPTTACSLHEDILGKENESNLLSKGASPPLSARIRELSNNLKSLCVSTESSLKIAQDSSILYNHINESMEPKTPSVQPSLRGDDKFETSNMKSPWESCHMRGSAMKDSVIKDFLKLLNSGSKQELKGIKGIGDKRSTYIIEMREESPEPFKKLDDLQDIGLSEKQIKGILKNVAGDLFI